MLRMFTAQTRAAVCLALPGLLLPLAAAADDALEDQAIAWLQEFASFPHDVKAQRSPRHLQSKSFSQDFRNKRRLCRTHCLSR